MSSKSGARSSFGNVDHLDSGRWRARYTGPDGRRRSATYTTRSDARVWLSTAHSDVVRRQWRAPESGRQTVGEYAADYLARSDLREGTKALYASLWRLHLAPTWSEVAVEDVSASDVHRWHEQAATATRPTALAQAHRLLRAILNVAADDEILSSNPCRLRSGGKPKPARPSRSLTVADVRALAEQVPARYRVLVLVLAFGGLRFGEATALRRSDVLVSENHLALRVERSVRQIAGRSISGPPKSDAGHRTVALPQSVGQAHREHMETFVRVCDYALVFGTRSGNFLARSNFSGLLAAQCARSRWSRYAHELRHTGATLAARTGASTAGLMRRLGHSSPAAALIYQHASAQREIEIADAVDFSIEKRGAGGPLWDRDGASPGVSRAGGGAAVLINLKCAPDQRRCVLSTPTKFAPSSI